MAEFGMRQTKLPTEIIVMVLSELTHAEAWRLRILCSTVNDWVHNVLVKRALQSSSLVARSPASFIFYEAPDSVHGLRFSFLQKHGSSAIFQARTTEKRELELFHQKTYLHIVAHLSNNHDPIIIRHLKVKELSLDRDSMTLQCNWRNLLTSAFNMSARQRVDQAQSIRPQYVWQPAKIDGMPGKWRKGLSWLHTESQGEQTSNLSSLQLDYLQQPAYARLGHPVFELQLDPGYKRHAYLHHIPRKLESLFLFPALPDQRRPPVFSPRHDGRFTTMPEDTGLSILNSISVYQDSSCSSNPSQRPSGEGSRSSILDNLGLDGTKLNPAPTVDDDDDDGAPGPSSPPARNSASETQITVVNRYTLVIGPEEPADRERSPPAVASSPMSESLYTQSATIRPALRGGGSSPLGVLEEEDSDQGEDGDGDGDTSYMLASEHDVSRMLVPDDEFEDELGDQGASQGQGEDPKEDEAETQPDDILLPIARCRELGRTDSKSSSQAHSFMTDATDVEVISVYSLDEKERRMRTVLSDDAYAASASMKLGKPGRFQFFLGRLPGVSPRLTLSPEARKVRSRRDTGLSTSSPCASVGCGDGRDF
ncbi:hypothetical protein RHS01_08172 [Rhizoctonia solani]|uniref:F-box domain-containing protein n=1 Tax=Rhizoctonia solani TaxID=456999 RepID=A0A8H7I8I5_9AGAM|nr:hypothetical protein RHS01_08172 [Rhizoctonia solani]